MDGGAEAMPFIFGQSEPFEGRVEFLGIIRAVVLTGTAWIGSRSGDPPGLGMVQTREPNETSASC